MEAFSLKERLPIESPKVEHWDDEDFDNLDDIQFRTASTATSIISHPHRDSISSRLSLRSESNHGDENWDVLVDEQASVKDAIAIAKSKGIPIPANVPRSALEGGTIRRLKGKEIKKAIADDWSEDLDLPVFNGPLKLAKTEDKDFPESLRQISAAFHKSPAKSPDVKDLLDQTIRSAKSRVAAPISLDQFRDIGDDDDSFTNIPTIRVAKHRSPQKPILFQPPVPKQKPEIESIEEDLELPPDGPLKLSTRKPPPRTPQQNDDFDMEWAEGSLGTRHAGTRRAGRSNRSSSASALSPSVSSAFTAESEDEGLDGLLLPDGPLKFQEALKRRQENQSPDRSDYSAERNVKRVDTKEDFFADIEIGDGDPFDSAKLTLHRNIKHKLQRPTSPSKRTTTTLNFTSTKTQTTISRLPRFQPLHDRHERVRSNLEPVSESGAAVSRYKRPESRLGQHAAQASISAIPSPSIPVAPSTPSRRGLRNAESRPDLRYEAPTTTHAQLLKSKRSIPIMRGHNSPTKPAPRPPSRQDGSAATSRLNITSRPKTPTDRTESRLGDARKPPIPFLPAGASATQSQHVSIKSNSTRHYRRQDSDGSNESTSLAYMSLSRLAGRPETPGRGRTSLTPAELVAAVKKPITKPTRRHNFGDGTELEVFDDLPTSATQESRFIKEPIGRGAPRSLRSKLSQTLFAPSTTSLATARAGTETPMPLTPLTLVRPDFNTHANVPRFARDTAASRNAREQRQVSTTFHNMRGEPLQPISTNFKSHLQNRPGPTPSPSLRKRNSKVQKKPYLIKPMGIDISRAKTEKGMQYNPDLFCWEGNENVLGAFDVPDFTPRDSSPLGGGRSSPGAKLALIANVGALDGGVQVVGGMVFDPRRMCWLKIAENVHEGGSNLRGSSVGYLEVEEEDDVFAGLEDLKEESESVFSAGFGGEKPQARNVSGESTGLGTAGDGEGHSGDEWGISEEFDVGPAFVKRQRSEEEKWRRKVEKWLRSSGMEGGLGDQRGGWRWAVRELVVGGLQ